MSRIWNQVFDHLRHQAEFNPEWRTTPLWEYFFNKSTFAHDRFIEGDRRRVDLVVETMGIREWEPLLFVEAKRTMASVDDITTVEFQAFTAACACSVQNKFRPVWAMTIVGSKARLWTYSFESDYLIPFEPKGQGLSTLGEYLELSTDGQRIVNALGYIERNPIPPDHLLKAPSTPRPANPQLPPDWHADEVDMADEYRMVTLRPALQSSIMAKMTCKKWK
ncbi:uncharacterized protein C8A04DRAFT_40393 [Dichotomopilus funicola]|uniref:Uncharacterized protein n=1 Tax=Dichotomopilus funicola TaxID=1934379 RepID=A0AAN6UVS0_9PEZI|nr:hypothetical protein C8A04DRAFT_40393 [Dichotomopilus funicola]